MKPFCETIVQITLPAVRALVAKDLIEKHKIKQQDVALKLGVSQGAVSQYRRDIRGFKVKFLQKDKEIIDEIEKLASRLANENLTILESNDNVCSICKLIRKKKLICEMHLGSLPGVEKCNCCNSTC